MPTNWSRLRSLDERRATILESIAEQGKLTDELRQAVESATTMTALEDLYAPYKPKRRTRASIARAKGLEGLAEHILHQTLTRRSIEDIVQEFYLSDESPHRRRGAAGGARHRCRDHQRPYRRTPGDPGKGAEILRVER